ncbi:hypothetical protein DYB36_003967 [Aphanomyces astaci]|uniref:Uncharacterized protein n=1 Tax=Aphanomyces astaci TaxID=112090 RepID=A0A397AF15_APHAT|nr:hypothetical protein DYB36_003967 [Aphanomyces astaci]
MKRRELHVIRICRATNMTHADPLAGAASMAPPVRMRDHRRSLHAELELIQDEKNDTVESFAAKKWSEIFRLHLLLTKSKRFQHLTLGALYEHLYRAFPHQMVTKPRLIGVLRTICGIDATKFTSMDGESKALVKHLEGLHYCFESTNTQTSTSTSKLTIDSSTLHVNWRLLLLSLKYEDSHASIAQADNALPQSVLIRSQIQYEDFCQLQDHPVLHEVFEMATQCTTYFIELMSPQIRHFRIYRGRLGRIQARKQLLDFFATEMANIQAQRDACAAADRRAAVRRIQVRMTNPKGFELCVVPRKRVLQRCYREHKTKVVTKQADADNYDYQRVEMEMTRMLQVAERARQDHRAAVTAYYDQVREDTEAKVARDTIDARCVTTSRV